MWTKCIAIAIAIAISATCSRAEIIIVDPEGLGDKLLIQQAINSATSGDEILVRPGTYNEQITVDKNITISGIDPTLCKIIYSGSGNAITFTSGSRNAQLLRLSITSSGGNGIFCNDNSSPVIKNCIIEGSSENGVHVEEANPTVINNTISSNRLAGVYIANRYTSSQPTISNNIIASNNTGIRSRDSPIRYPISYNDVWGNGIQYGNTASSIRAYSETNLPTTGISLNPQFVDPVNGDFHLLPNSPCIDAGSSSSVYADLDGTRNDMGVYGGPDAPLPVVSSTSSSFQILSALDVPNDQGRKIRLVWQRHSNDAENAIPQITRYSLWRKFDPDLPSVRMKATSDFGTYPDGEWTFIGEVPASGTETYAAVVPTLADSTISSGLYRSSFFIRAHVTDPSPVFDAQPDSGYSIDNLAPRAPSDLSFRTTNTRAKLVWKNVGTADLSHYAIYRGNDEEFAVNSPYATTTDIEFEDIIDDANPYYRVAAFDYAGNRSPLSQVILVDSGEPSLPTELPPASTEISPIVIDFDLEEGDQSQRIAAGAVPGKTYTLQLNVASAPMINGWSATIHYDTSKLRYVEGSFKAGSFISGLLGLVDTKEGSVEIGGTVLGADDSNVGDGTLGTLVFEVLEGLTDSTRLELVETNFRRLDGQEDKRSVLAFAQINTEPEKVGLRSTDINDSGDVDFEDFFIFADHFGSSNVESDFNGDGRVDFEDFFIFADSFGPERSKLIAIATELIGLPSAPTLFGNYPNPFNPETAIAFFLPYRANISLNIYSLSGQKIRGLVFRQNWNAGRHEVLWDGTDDRGSSVSSGVYLYQIVAGQGQYTGKMLLLR